MDAPFPQADIYFDNELWKDIKDGKFQPTLNHEHEENITFPKLIISKVWPDTPHPEYLHVIVRLPSPSDMGSRRNPAHAGISPSCE
jgi:hypothetical protein